MFDIPKFWQLNFVHQPINVDTLHLRVCLVLHFTQKILGFGPSFYRMELNTMQKILAKRYLFSILDFGLKRQKKGKKQKKPSPTP
jgi:hypothetical protein